MTLPPTPLTSTPRASYLPGTAFATTFLKKIRTCPMSAYFTYWAPHPHGGIGLESPILGKPLAIGKFTHTGLEAYHLAEGSLPAGLLAIETSIKGYSGPLIDDLPEVLRVALLLLTQYHAHWAGNLLPLISRDGQPVVERRLEAPMGYRDYVFTAVLDTLVSDQGTPWILEHKTVDAGKVSELLRMSSHDTQLTGQLFLATACGFEPAGLLISGLIKRAAKDKPKCFRHPTSRTPLELEKFRLDVVTTLTLADQSLETYQALVASGMPPFEAARQTFPTHGDRHCAWCPFSELCLNPLHISNFAATFLPRRPPEKE